MNVIHNTSHTLKINKKIRLITISLFIILTLQTTSVTSNAITPNVATDVNIFVIAPLTGGLAFSGSNIPDVVNLAIDKLNLDSSINSSFHFITGFYDSESIDEIAPFEAARTDGAHVIIGMGIIPEIATNAASNQIPYIAYGQYSIRDAETNDHNTGGDKGYTWRTSDTDAANALAMSELATLSGFSSISVLSKIGGQSTVDLTNYNEAKLLKSEFEKMAGNSVSIHNVSKGETNFSNVVNAIKSEDSDLLVLLTDYSESTDLYTEIQSQGIESKIAMGEGNANQLLIDSLGENNASINGYAFVERILNESTIRDNLILEYETAYSRTYNDFLLSPAYDAVLSAGYAVASGNSVNGNDVIQELSGIRFEGVTGTVSFDDTGGSKAAHINIIELRDEMFVTVGNWDAYHGLNLNDNGFVEDWKKVVEPNLSSSSTTSSSTSSAGEGTSTSNGATPSSSSDSFPFPFQLPVVTFIFAAIYMIRKHRDN